MEVALLLAGRTTVPHRKELADAGCAFMQHVSSGCFPFFRPGVVIFGVETYIIARYAA